MKKLIPVMLLAVSALLFCADHASAQRRLGGGHMAMRGTARASVNARPHVAQRATGDLRQRNTSINRDRARETGRNGERTIDVNRDRTVNRDINIDRDINVNRDIDINAHGGWYDDHDGCCEHPWAAAAVVADVAATTAAVNTALAIGSVVNTLPATCVSEVIGGVVYENCGGTWYAPRFEGTGTTYVVVAPPM
ncbi:MAG TPA: hypothetical protein VFR81_16840 [Longimicrobium sp.]|nr:hypothetical protein [Longimicrobium sp.]